ncbi:UDP-glucosyltransferase 2-like [Aricia agestis]|uniref:UDP-glucosyltransferase 2-like n=1 Tax=Aricia agestis TaxID=91739 RepID=UPI001C208039|nr:UDP-glucosyltransferase 2-like [Aricia agestis]
MFKCLLLLFGVCSGYKVLVVFPVPGKSHAILGEAYVRHLLEAGHEVTYITPLPIKGNLQNLRQVDVFKSTKLLHMADVFDLQKLMYHTLDLQGPEMIFDMMYEVASLTLRSEPVQNLINDPNEEFDAVIVEWLYNEMGAGFSSVFGCPLIWSSSMVPHTSILSLIDEHINPAYNRFHLSRQHSLSLADRAYNLWIHLRLHYHKWKLEAKEDDLFKEVFGPAIKKRGRELPDFNDVRYNGSMVLGNSDVSIGDNIALPQNYKNIGGYHLKNEVKPLTQEMRKIMDDAKHGVIYFSLGSMLQSSRMPERLKRETIQMFGQLNQTVIWKIDENIPNLPKNVHLISWAPQQSILAHPNCVLFITHGGLLSIIEAINYGIPLISMPFFADQYINSDRLVEKGFGKRLDLTDGRTDDSPKRLKGLIDEMLIHNTSYSTKAMEVSAIFHTRLTPPGKELVFWVEYVIQTGGARHLRSTALSIEAYKKLHLDIILIVALVVISVLYVLVELIREFQIKVKIE